MQNGSEADFSCKLNLDLKIHRRALLGVWLVALALFLISSPFFWRLVERHF